MMPPAYKPHPTVTFSGWIFTPKSIILLIRVFIEPKMTLIAEHNFSIFQFVNREGIFDNKIQWFASIIRL